MENRHDSTDPLERPENWEGEPPADADLDTLDESPIEIPNSTVYLPKTEAAKTLEGGDLRLEFPGGLAYAGTLENCAKAEGRPDLWKLRISWKLTP